MNKYFPSGIFISVGKLRTFRVKGADGFVDEEFSYILPYCKLFKSKSKRHGRTQKGEFENLEFSSIRLGMNEENNAVPIVEIDGQSYALKQDAIHSGTIIKLLILNGIKEDGTLAGSFRLYSNHAGEPLKLMHSSEELWEELSAKEEIREKSFGSKELKIGNVYRQVAKYGSDYFLYLGRVRDPSTKKLCYSFIQVNSCGKGINSKENIESVKQRLENLFKYEDTVNKYNYRRFGCHSINITSSIPSNLVFDDGAFKFKKASPNGISVTTETIESLIQETVAQQWLEYQQRVEIAKAMGREERDRWSRNMKFVWDEPTPPSWLDFSKRIK